MYSNGPTAVWVGVTSSGPRPSAELREWWWGKPTLGEDAGWGPDSGPYVMLYVDIVGLTDASHHEGHLAGDQLIAQLFERLTDSTGPGRIYWEGPHYFVLWHGRDVAFAEATVAALQSDSTWGTRVHGDLVEAPTGPGLANRLRYAGEPPAVGIRDLRSVALLAQHAGLVSDEPDKPWREVPWDKPVPVGQTLDYRFPRRPPPPVPGHLCDLPMTRPNAELRELIHRDTRADGPYLALLLHPQTYPWGQVYDDHHPDGRLGVRVAQLLHSCIGPGRYYPPHMWALVLWQASDSRHAEHALAVVTAEPTLSPFVLGYLVEEHGPRLGQVLRRLEHRLEHAKPGQSATAIVDLRNTTPLVTAKHRTRQPGSTGLG